MGQKGRHVLSERDDLILRAVHELHFVTVEQITRLYFSTGSVTHVREILKHLCDEGYLRRLKMPSSQDGVKPWVYTLASAGMRYLKSAGVKEFGRVSPSEHIEHSYLFLAHTLGVNDIVIGAKLLQEEAPAYVLADFLHERELRRRPVHVKTSQDGAIAIVPDLWLDMHIGGSSRASITLEYDRGTVSAAAWQRKIRGLIAFADGPYQEAYGSESLTIAIATTAGEHRAQQIRGWIEHELEQAYRRQDGELFLVMALPDQSFDANAFFLTRVWQQPFGTQLVTLLGS